MTTHWDVPVFYTSADEAERETGHFAITTIVVTEELGRRILKYLGGIGVITFHLPNKSKTSQNTYTVNFIARFYTEPRTMWFTEGGRFGNLSVPTGHTVKRDGEVADRFAPSLATIESFNRVVEATPSLTQIYYWAAKRYRSGILKMCYTRDRSPDRTALHEDDFGPDFIAESGTSPNQLRRLMPRPGAEDRVAAQTTLRAALRLARRKAAERMGVPSYIVLHDHQIEGLVEARPKSNEQLSDLIGPKKTAQFGECLLEALRAAQEGDEETGARPTGGTEL